MENGMNKAGTRMEKDQSNYAWGSTSSWSSSMPFLESPGSGTLVIRLSFDGHGSNIGQGRSDIRIAQERLACRGHDVNCCIWMFRLGVQWDSRCCNSQSI